jgi:hypothetical protein
MVEPGIADCGINAFIIVGVATEIGMSQPYAGLISVTYLCLLVMHAGLEMKKLPNVPWRI